MQTSSGHRPLPSGPGRPFLRLARALGVCTLALASLVLAAPALAIPEAEALKKLAVIPVFILADSQGVPLPLERDQALVLPLYLERVKAEQELAAFQKANPTVKAGVLPLPLNVALERVTELNTKLTDRKLLSPVISGTREMDQAKTLLRQQGLDDQTIREGLSLPVFFTKPLLTIKTQVGERGVFFFDYASLENALKTVPDRSKLQVQAADFSAVMDQILKEPKDTFTFYPTPEYFRLVEEETRSGARSTGPGTGGPRP